MSAVLADADPEPSRWLGEEVARFHAMTAPQRRAQFLAGRWLARQAAAAFAGDDALIWGMRSAASGAAEWFVPATGAAVPVHLSISHSGDAVAVAVAAFPLGVDVQVTAQVRDWIGLAGRVFAPGERAHLRALPPDARADAFYTYWTLREALGKQDGHGLRLAGAGAGCARECPHADAVAFTWRWEGHGLALVGERGMRIDAQGIPSSANSCGWRFEAGAQTRN